MKKANNFQIVKIYPQGGVLLRFWLIFCQFQPNFSYKSVAYKNKKHVMQY